jgi:hypothetical protein
MVKADMMSLCGGYYDRNCHAFLQVKWSAPTGRTSR